MQKIKYYRDGISQIKAVEKSVGQLISFLQKYLNFFFQRKKEIEVETTYQTKQKETVLETFQPILNYESYVKPNPDKQPF